MRRRVQCVLALAFLLTLAMPGANAARRHSARRRPSRHVSLATAVQEILANPEVARAHWGISVVTLQGKPIFALNDGQMFEPASNAKLFTTAGCWIWCPRTPPGRRM